MNAVIVIAHAPLASALRAGALHVFPDAADDIAALDVHANLPPEESLATAQAAGVPVAALDHKAYPDREAFDRALMARIDAYAPDLVVLAGFMRILTPGFVAHYEGRLINIHPSLLPAFTGLHTHQRAIDAGCKFAGCTVHRVTAELDVGPILEQAVVPVLQGDTAELLAARVLVQEHIIYPQAVLNLIKA